MRSLYVYGAAFALLVSACEEDEEPLGFDPTKESEFAGALADTFCGLTHEECGCTEPTFASKGECIQGFVALLQPDFDAAKNAGLIFDPECAVEIIADLKSVGCATPGQERPNQCGVEVECDVYRGNQTLGQACMTQAKHSNCARGLLCIEGTCAESCITVPEGGQCTAGQLRCAAGLDCESSGCTAPPALGESCTSKCEEGAYCEGGSCVPSKPDGAPCSGFTSARDPECLSGTCIGGTTCGSGEASICP